MEIRKITQQELPEIRKLLSVAFEFGENEDEQDFIKKLENPQYHQHRDYMNRYAAFEDGEMMAALASYDYNIQFDGGEAGMGGVADVATFPQHRRKGAVRKCMEYALLQMHQKGQIFSYLYPFSTAFYEKLGYGPSCEKMSWEILMQHLPQEAYAGAFENCDPIEDLRPFQQIYETFIKGRNLAVIREEIDWQLMRERNRLKEKKYTYLYRKKDGTPAAFLTMTPQQEGRTRVLDCRNFWFTDRESIVAMLSFLKGFSANYDLLRFWSPADLNLTMLLREYVNSTNNISIERKLEFCGMIRVVDAAQVLRMANYLGEGTAVVQIEDKLCPWNEKTFLVEFEPDGAQVQETQAPADICLPVSLFSQLMIGNYDPWSLGYLREFEAAKNKANLEKIFYRKPMWIHDYF